LCEFKGKDNLGRILILIIIGVLIWLIFRGFFRVQTKKKADLAAKTVVGEDMVACARCGVNLPRSEAREEGGAYICRDNPRCLEAR
jgi:uncharacterized protein